MLIHHQHHALPQLLLTQPLMNIRMNAVNKRKRLAVRLHNEVLVHDGRERLKPLERIDQTLQ